MFKSRKRVWSPSICPPGRSMPQLSFSLRISETLVKMRYIKMKSLRALLVTRAFLYVSVALLSYNLLGLLSGPSRVLYTGYIFKL